MSTIHEIEAAIVRLPDSEFDQLAAWIEQYRAKRTGSVDADAWLAKARGAAIRGVTTEKIMSLTRGEV